MQTWAKRGLQTALVTGGLLMLGTGIASADEDVNPDKPASPLDGSATVPVHLDNNVVGTPLGSRNVPGVHQDASVSTTDVNRAVPVGATATAAAHTATGKAKRTEAGVAAPSVDAVRTKVSSFREAARDQAAPLEAEAAPVVEGLDSLPGGDKLGHVPTVDDVRVPSVDVRQGGQADGNHIRADVVAPVDVSGNAVAVLGKAETTNVSSQTYGDYRYVVTSGRGGFASGNAVDADWAAPVQATNNAVAVFGKASTRGVSSQEAYASGDVVADGTHSVAGGNVVAPQFATPVQADGNAVAGGGIADTYSAADTTATSGGFVLTSGEDSLGGGNAVPVPAAVPVKANGNAVMGLGKSVTDEQSSANATAGTTRAGKYGVPTYVETSGDPALAAGNIVDPSASGPVLLCGNAGGVSGIAAATCDTASETTAGGTNPTTG
jgi:trimeric autotransporter adhesin